MKIIFFSAKPYDEEYFKSSNVHYQHDIHFVEARLFPETVSLLNGESVVCTFVNDSLDRAVLSGLSQAGVKLIALRCAGYNNVDLKSTQQYGLRVVRVPAYSPYAVAEHALCLMLALNRKVYRAYNRVREGNFSLEGLLGFDFHGRTLGLIGSGRIGLEVARITTAMGVRVLISDPLKNPQCEKLGAHYVDIEQLLVESDVISLHCPLTPQTKYLINETTISKMKKGVMLINTSRGAALDTCAAIEGLKSKKIGYLGIDVYEQEHDLFFEDLSCEIIPDEIFARLLTFPNVLITAHQGFYTAEALTNIANTTLENISQFEAGKVLENEVLA
jgi:D-lactate dehydrogenase